ncbi:MULTISPECIES: HipA family kinase [Campylobacter]|uniref:HipA family kinase n=1 Tax=Campylobacter TaxID=194 RepID=UPI0008752652|nr:MULTISPECIES: HipA family kinase [Campylobacter]OEW14473.1 hypothetical protein AJ935_03780 [Campylobacter sp. BCW_6876]OEV42042.1 hypothetical protein AJY57_04100 [Campylobacter jejuni]OEV42459.1 hypothetical protein AJY58_02735 [Campylobacter jejuni]OEW01266.1 hypothetical protein AJY54_06055 [Campylobacter jejuni]OEW19761.1 hypothetical protein AJ939_08290 [Campylobacter sp. BCW_6889]
MRVKLNIFEISNIIRVTDYGASCPLEVSIKDNSKFILKTKYNSVCGTGKSLFAELFSYLYLQELNFKDIPGIALLNIDDDFIKLADNKLKNGTQRDKEALENIKNSKGLNLGISYIFNASKIYPKELTNKFKNYTCLYDGILMNSDREFKNPNILINDLKKIFLIDFGLAFDILKALNIILDDEINSNQYFDKNTFDKNYLLLDHLKHIKINKKKLNCQEILDIINAIPLEWLSLTSAQKQALSNMIYKRQGQKAVYSYENV